MINKLQFIHQNTVFANREAAKTYLKELIVNTRPSLYAEPLVVKYESGDDAKGPNLLLAVGSVGDGKYDGEYNRTQQRLFFIDIAYCEEEIEAIWERIEEIVSLLTVIPLESDTISLHTSVTPEGTEISGDVRVADAQVIHGVSRPNQINVVPDDGLYHFVDVSYSDNGVLTFQVNDEVKDMSIPVLTGGTYHYDDEDAENLVLSMSNGETVKVNLRKLIDEWTVLPINAITTPIVLKKEKINSEDLPYGVNEWQDVLTADIRLHEGDGNILYKNDSGRTLYATVNLEYNEIENKLVFTWSENGQVNTKDIALNSVKLIEYIRYDAVKEEIVIGYKTSASGETIEVRIPVGDLITEWVPVSETHNVILNRTRNISGTDEVTADVRIASKDIVPSNIVETIGENKAIFVRGEADNIKFGNTNVQAELERLDSEDDRIEAKFDDETAFLSGTCDTINATIGTGFTDNPHETITYKFAEISGYTSGIEEDLQDEINRATAAEDFISGAVDSVSSDVTFVSGAVDTVDNKIGTGFTDDPHTNVTAQFEALSAYTSGVNDALSGEVERATAAEDFISGAVDFVSGSVDNVSGVVTTINNTIGSGFTDDPHSNVTAQFEALSAYTSGVNNNLNAEIERSQAADNFLSGSVDFVSGAVDTVDDKIGSGFTDDPHTNVTAKFEALSAYTSGVNNNLDDEIERAQAAENALSASVGFVSGAVDTTNANLANEINRSTTQDEQLKADIDSVSAATATKISGITGVSGITVDSSNPTNPKISLELNQDSSNILTLNREGLYTTVDLTYNDSDNKLIFSTTKGSKEIALNSIKFIEYIDYDEENEEIVIGYKTAASGEVLELRIPVGDLITEWVPVSEGHNVILNRTRVISGTDEVTADVRIASKDVLPLNILETVGDNKSLYVRGEANNIKFGNTNVQAELERLDSEDIRIESKFDDRTAFLSGAVDTVDNKIGSGFTDDPHSNVTAQFEALSAYTSGVNNNLNAEIERSQAADNFLSGSVDSVSGAVDTVDNKIGSGFTDDPHTNVTAKFEALSGYSSGVSADLQAEIDRAQAAENFLSGSVDTVTGRVTALEEHSEDTDEFIGRIVEGVGLNSDGTYKQMVTAKYISGATSVEDALEILNNSLDITDIICGDYA